MAGSAGNGVARRNWRASVGLGEVGLGGSRFGRRGMVGFGAVRQGPVWHDMAGEARLGKARSGTAWQAWVGIDPPTWRVAHSDKQGGAMTQYEFNSVVAGILSGVLTVLADVVPENSPRQEDLNDLMRSQCKLIEHCQPGWFERHATDRDG